MSAEVFTVPAGTALVDALAAGLLERYRARPPEDLASVLVLIPTRRAAGGLHQAFLRQSGGRPLVLPVIRPIGDVDEDELSLSLMIEAEPLAALPPAIPTLLRRLLLARRIGSVGAAQGDEGAALLAEALAGFLDEVTTAEANLDDLGTLVEDAELSRHWQITLCFLRGVIADWPRELERLGFIEPALRRRLLMDSLAEHWRRRPPPTPVIAAGSTGTIPATARLLAVVAGLPRGAVVLPGLDRDMSDEAWELVEPGHPQHALKLLLDELECSRAAVRPWPVPEAAALPRGNDARRRLLSQALLPAEATACWADLPPPPPEALEGLEIVACANARTEAETAALAMREALETPERSVALITRDRALARRVAAELRRWRIEVDDSAGRPLALTPNGVFFRLVAQACVERLAPVPLLALLKHPLTRLGRKAGALRRSVRRLERRVLRGPRPAPGLEGLRAALDAIEGEDDGLVESLGAALAPLLGEFDRARVPLGRLVERHLAAARALAEGAGGRDADGRLWRGDDGEALARFVSELETAAGQYGALEPRAWPALLDSLLRGHVVRPRFGVHPRAFVWGPLEARMQHADCVILAGLVEGSWPPDPPADPWMSRPMRRRLGLPSPEQRIGQAAHDFVQGAAAARVVLLHARRSRGAPALPARWLARLRSLLDSRGPAAAIHDGSAPCLRWQALLDRPGHVEPARQPRPAPPLEARPRSLSVTEIGTWLRDPYAIYARRVLELEPLEEIDEDASAAKRGSFVHRALERFVAGHPDTLPDDALDRLLDIGRETLTAPLDRPALRAVWWRRFERIAAWFVATERERRERVCAVRVETEACLALEDGGESPFTLTARADRLEIDGDGRLHVIDYKTGRVPSDKAVREGRAPQLTLEAALAWRGAFDDVQAAEVAGIAHWRLSGGDPAGEVKRVDDDKYPARRLADGAWDGLRRLVAAFERPGTAYLDHPGGAEIGPYDDYVDIARTAEWRLGSDVMAPDPSPFSPPPAPGIRGHSMAQRDLLDPERTVWVAASAGTGKTKVLTDRVLRLLLQGTAPARILCLTFTKAAAAEMESRIRQALGAWLVLEREALERELFEITGRTPGAEEVATARRLLAATLDAPGGLRIATIHSFCQSLLARFPLEAGVPPQFAVIDERTRDDLLHGAREAVLARAGSGGDDRLGESLDTLAVHAGDRRLGELIGGVCAQGGRLRLALDRHGGLEAMIRATRRALGLAPGDTLAGIVAAAASPGAEIEAALRLACEALHRGTPTAVARAEAIERWLDMGLEARCDAIGTYRNQFLTQRGEPRKRLTADADPAAADTLRAEQCRMMAFEERRRAFDTLASTTALLEVSVAVLTEFERSKRARAALDYDDLIEKGRALLRDGGMAPWVLYKLDGGIDHVLVDEAQDTNPDQWDVVRALTDEFFAGEGAREQVRALFVVGDEKQSIFSFQGADLDALGAVRDDLRTRAQEAGGLWLEGRLDLSYRSGPAVLTTVDSVFAPGAGAVDGGMLSSAGAAIGHESARPRDAGLVELWPPVSDDEEEPEDVWLAAVENRQPRDRHNRLAAAVARKIAALMEDDGETLASRGGCRVLPGDVMVLVRRRGPLVQALMRELRRVRVPVAGRDRMELAGESAVRDLLALMRFCLMPGDDVSLAAVLKGPLVDVDEDGLFALAHARPRRGAGTEENARPEPLWASLARHAGESGEGGHWRRAHDWLTALLCRADGTAPFEFLSDVLTRPAATPDGFSGRKAFVRRLGFEAADPLDELLGLALEFEDREPPSLQRFLAWLAAGGSEVKREPEDAGDMVRIMTVHGAKGLQAPVVFLIDEIGAPGGRPPALLWDDARGIALWPGAEAGRPALARELHARRRKKEEQEERRLLYVAMTRACDRLYICATRAGRARDDGGWTQLVRDGMRPIAAEFAFRAPGDDWSGQGWRVERGRRPPPPPERPPGPDEPDAVLPELFRRAVAPERPSGRWLVPSRPDTDEPRSDAGAGWGRGLARGRLVHRLLELLPALPPDRRRQGALDLIARHEPRWAPEDADALARDVAGLLDDPAFAAVFGPGSAAEASLTGVVGETVVAGRVDRLAVTPESVLVVDYKTGSAPAGGAAAMPRPYLRQLGAYRALLRGVYPQRSTACAILWLDGPELVAVPDALLAPFHPQTPASGSP